MIADAPEVAGMGVSGLLRFKSDIDGNAGATKPCKALARDFRIGIRNRSHHPRNARRNDRVGAGRRLAGMRTGFKRDIERGPACGWTRTLKRHGFGMRTSAGLRKAAPHDDAIVDDHGADGGVRPSASEAAPPQRQRKPHEASVGLLCVPGFLGELIFQDPKDHLRKLTSRESSSPESSSSTASKSLASRKLR